MPRTGRFWLIDQREALYGRLAHPRAHPEKRTPASAPFGGGVSCSPGRHSNYQAPGSLNAASRTFSSSCPISPTRKSAATLSTSSEMS